MQSDDESGSFLRRAVEGASWTFAVVLLAASVVLFGMKQPFAGAMLSAAAVLCLPPLRQRLERILFLNLAAPFFVFAFLLTLAAVSVLQDEGQQSEPASQAGSEPPARPIEGLIEPRDPRADEFVRNRDSILGEASELLAAGRPGEAFELLSRYEVEDPALVGLRLEAQAAYARAELEREGLTQRQLAHLFAVLGDAEPGNAEVTEQAKQLAAQLAAESRGPATAPAEPPAGRSGGPSPSLGFKPWDGSHPSVVASIKARMSYPASFEHVDTQYRKIAGALVVTMRFRGQNRFGAQAIQTARADVDSGGEVVSLALR